MLRQLDEPPTTASAVHVIPHHRMSHRREMYADLMRAPGVQVRAQQVDRLEPRQSHEIRLRRSSGSDDCHALSVSRIARDRLVDGERDRRRCVPTRARHIAVRCAAPRDRRAELAQCARSVFATSSSPDVSLSRRWTIPARSSPLSPASAPPRPLSAFTSVPLQLPGAGCTTIPAGLSTTITCSSSNIDRERNVLGEHLARRRRRHHDDDAIAALGTIARLLALAPTVTLPFAISVAACVREVPSSRARKRSRRSSLSASSVNSCVAGSGHRAAASGARAVTRAWTRSPTCGSARRTIFLAPQRPREQERADAHRHVGDVERRPAPVAKADVEEVHDADRRAHAVDEIADRAAAHEPERDACAAGRPARSCGTASRARPARRR